MSYAMELALVERVELKFWEMTLGLLAGMLLAALAAL